MTRVYLIALAMLAFIPVMAGGDEPKKPEKDPTFMKHKLAAAQALLGAIALEDFPLIKEKADRLNDLSKLAAWKLIGTPRYESYSDEFQRITLKMSKQAIEKNIDGVALAYVDMTLTCVKCHQHVREQKYGMAPPPRQAGSAVGE